MCIYVIMKLIYIKQGNYGGGNLGEFTAKTVWWNNIICEKILAGVIFAESFG